jgi:hypothetical protein
MAVSEKDKIIIRRIIEKSVITREDLIQKMNLFYADTLDADGIIGWKLLNQIAEYNPYCRTFVHQVADESGIHREMGEYVKEVILKNVPKMV